MPAPDHADKLSAYIGRIRAAYPDLAVEGARLVTGEGQFNDVVILTAAGEGELVFRFPRYQAGVERLVAETAILRAIRGAVPLPVPDPIYQRLAPREVGEVFTGYRLLPGVPLRREMLRGPETAEGEAAPRGPARQLAGFLRALHRTPLDALARAGAGLGVEDGRERWADLYARIRGRLFPRMRADARAAVADHFERFLTDARHGDWAPALRHGDFGGGNLLVDPATGAIAGVLDFGSAGLGDPAVDLAAILATAGQDERFLRQFLAAYPELASGVDRARFYGGTFALQEALHGVEHGDREAFESGIAAYR